MKKCMFTGMVVFVVMATCALAFAEDTAPLMGATESDSQAVVSSVSENTEFADILTPGPFVTWTALLWEKGTLAIQPFFFYTITRGAYDADGVLTALPDGDKITQVSPQLFVQYGITDNIEIDAQIIGTYSSVSAGGVSAATFGVSDAYLMARGCAMEEAGINPCITGLFQVKIPTGKYQEAVPDKLGTDIMGTGSYDYSLGLNFTKSFAPIRLHWDIIYGMSAPAFVDGVKTEYGNLFNYSFALEWVIGWGLSWMAEVNGYVQDEQKDDNVLVSGTAGRNLMVGTGLGWSNDVVQVSVGYQRVLNGRNSDATDVIVATAIFPLYLMPNNE